MLEDLRRDVCRANRALVERGLVKLTFGNASGIDRKENLVVIKPSGVPYAGLVPEQMLVVDISGNVVEGNLKPSTDTPTHLRLYQRFEEIGGITHAHSPFATMFAQARREIPCFGTTHADHFRGAIPVTRPLKKAEVEEAYEANTASVIIERFEQLDATAMPAVLVAGHGPFTWGNDVGDSLDNAVALETVAEMAYGTRLICPDAPDLEPYVLEKHHKRKHGSNAYYGQD